MTKTIGPGLACILLVAGTGGLAVADPPTGGALPPQMTLEIPVAGVHGVPLDAVGVALNVTVTNPAAAGFVTVYPCGTRPLASNLNFVAGQTVPNFVVSALDFDGYVCIDTMSVTDVVVDLAGYLPASSTLVTLDAPRRFLDTRDGTGAPRARVAAGAVLAVPIAGLGGVPADAAGVVLNATVVSPSAIGYLTVFPCGQAVPETSTLNYAEASVVPNLVISGLGQAGSVCLSSFAETDLVVDVAAYIPAGSTGLSVLSKPTRIFDSRIGLGGPTAQVGSDVRAVAVAGVAGVPAGATAAIVNLTATNAAASGYAAALPCGGLVPLVSNLNFAPGQHVANMAIVKLGDGGGLCLTANRPVDLIVDVTGYVAGPGGPASFVPLTPLRIYDSRVGVEPACGVGLRSLIQPDRSYRHELVDLATGAVRSFVDPPQFSGSMHSYVGTDCKIYMSGFVNQYGTIEVYSATGVRLDSYAPFGFPSFSSLSPGAPSYLGVRSFAGVTPTVVDPRTGADIFKLPVLPENPNGGSGNWRILGVSADRQLFLMHVYGGAGTAEAGPSLWNPVLGRLVTYDRTRVPSPVDISPSGELLVARSALGNGTTETVILTIDGQRVASTVSATRFSGFMTDGALLGCGPIPGTLGPDVAWRWDIFTDPKPLVPGQPTMPCVVSAK